MIQRSLGLAWLVLVAPLILSACGPSTDPASQASNSRHIDAAALDLRSRGIAELENEDNDAAESTFATLAQRVIGDPLPFANLAIARLRQQDFEGAQAAVDQALALTPEDARVLAVQAEILRWQNDFDGAVAVYRKVALARPDDVQAQFAAYEVASVVRTEQGEQFANTLLQRLAELRPENLVIQVDQLLAATRDKDRERASRAALRIRELMWQAPETALDVSRHLLGALNDADMQAAERRARQLGNLLKTTAMFKQGRRELSPGIQGMPLLRFAGEPPTQQFGDPIAVGMYGNALVTSDTAVRQLALADLDGDGRAEFVIVEDRALRVLTATGDPVDAVALQRKPLSLSVVDLNNDGTLDILIADVEHGRSFHLASGRLVKSTAEDEVEFALAGSTQMVPLDYDIEGDLDLAVAAPAGLDLLRNNLQGPLQSVGGQAFAEPMKDVNAIAVGDLDRDGDLDLVVASAGTLLWLDNQRQGEFLTRSLRPQPFAVATLAVGDLDGDGWPEIVVGGAGVYVLKNTRNGFVEWARPLPPVDGDIAGLSLLDINNDGRLDLLVHGESLLQIWSQQPDHAFVAVDIQNAPQGASAVAYADMDEDGDLDVLVAHEVTLYQLENQGGNRNHWLRVQLRGLNTGNSKNNVFGLGATLELQQGDAYQYREVDAPVMHLGLGQHEKAEVLRVVWTNGVPQNRLDVGTNQSLVESQVLKGSCPFVYVWDGEGFRFVTDLLWGAPIGLPVAPGAWASSDPGEIIRLDGAIMRDGGYDLRVTEELWEAAFFDQVRLWVVDHPADVEVASNLRIVPGGEPVAEKVFASTSVVAFAEVRDQHGRDLSERVARRDEVYADAWQTSPYQGVAAQPWSITLDLGQAPAQPVRLIMDGWIFPADASLNLAVAQRSDLPYSPPRLEVEVDGRWQTLMANMGFPAGKTKTMVVDTPALPSGAQRLRIVSNLWLGWDRLAWTAAPRDAQLEHIAKLTPSAAELSYRGFSALRRAAPNAPHSYDYSEVSQRSPWLPFAGRYTRYGDVLELLNARDDRSVIMGPGDEIQLRFDASQLPEPSPGMQRTLFLESFGWDKDADRNTYAAAHVDPLPFAAMSGYPYGPDEHFPDTPLHRAYQQEWLTRVVPQAEQTAQWSANASPPPTRAE